MYSGMGVHSQLYFISSIIELRSSIILENFTGFSDSASESLKPVKFSSIICNCFNPLTVVHHRYPSSLNIINIVFIKIVFIIAVSDHRFMIIVCVLKSVRTAANQYISDQLSSNYTDLLNMYFSHRHTTKRNTALGAGNCFVIIGTNSSSSKSVFLSVVESLPWWKG